MHYPGSASHETCASFAACLICCAAILAQIPAQDLRNTQTPDTDTHFAVPRFESRAAWEQRKAALRPQLLSAVGLFPMPERTPLHPLIFDRQETRRLHHRKGAA